jgi:hypothetical protein
MARRGPADRRPAPAFSDLTDDNVADLVKDIRLVHKTLSIYPITEGICSERAKHFQL